MGERAIQVLKFRFRWYFTHEGAVASMIYHDAQGGPGELTRGQAMTLARGR